MEASTAVHSMEEHKSHVERSVRRVAGREPASGKVIAYKRGEAPSVTSVSCATGAPDGQKSYAQRWYGPSGKNLERRISAQRV